MWRSFVFFPIAALAEIGGCFAFWVWLRREGSPLWAVVGLACLVVFAVALTRVDSDSAGRAFAAYGGVYVVSSLLWLRLVEKRAVDLWDLAGAALCLAGSCVILATHRGSGH